MDRVSTATRTFLAAAAALLVGCGGAGSGQQPSWRNRSDPIRAPAKPGSSISHTKMCECTQCDPRSCCAGDVSNAETGDCGETHDFTSAEGCGMSVHSCASRCSKHVWRIPTSQSCAATMPDVCCEH